jgi:hypothetical protein
MTSGVSKMARVALACMALVAAQSSGAQPRDAARLGKDLTGVGAEPGGGAGGAIPAFSPAGALEQGWAPGKRRGDFFKFKGDKPLYSIDGTNVDQHAAKLSPGQVALLKQVRGYRMDVYPSRRTCANPDFVLDNTKKNMATAKLGADGWSLKDAVLPGIPFPMPANGAEAMWNAKLKYAGIGYEWPLNYIGRCDADLLLPVGQERQHAAGAAASGGVLHLLRLRITHCAGGPGAGHRLLHRQAGRHLLLLPRPAPRAPHADLRL